MVKIKIIDDCGMYRWANMGAGLATSTTDPRCPTLYVDETENLGLTEARILYGSSTGGIAQEAGFEYNATSNTLTVPNATISGLAALNTGAVVYIGAAGELSAENGFEYDAAGNVLTASAVTLSGLAALNTGAVLYIGAAGEVSAENGFEYTAASDTLTVGVVVAGVGAVGTPSLTFLGQTTDGFYSASATQIGVAVNGALVAGFNTAGVFTGAIAEQVAAAGVTIDSMLVKDGGVVMVHGTAAEAANAVTINQPSGVITTSALTNAAGASYSFTFTNSFITATSVVMLDRGAYSGTIITNGVPYVSHAAPGAGTIVITVTNIHAANALSGTLAIGFVIV